MTPHLRIARPVSRLELAVPLYLRGLDWQRIGGFVDHQGFDGVMLGPPGGDFHLEFTCCRGHPVAPSPTPEDLLVFYIAQHDAWAQRCNAMVEAGFVEVESFNPYWKVQGRTFADGDGYRVVIQRAAWPRTAAQDSA